MADSNIPYRVYAYESRWATRSRKTFKHHTLVLYSFPDEWARDEWVNNGQSHILADGFRYAVSFSNLTAEQRKGAICG